MLSNLLQELTLAKDYGRERIILDEARLNENPVARLTRLIRKSFWDRLTRRIDAAGLEIIAADPKNRTKNQQPRIYIPYGEQEQYDYYVQTAKERPHLNLIVEWLPKDITPEWVKSVNDKPGLLALAMETVRDGTGRTALRGYPFVVPGGRFNEMYGWDSYFETLGLLVDGKIELARGMVENFIYEIKVLFILYHLTDLLALRKDPQCQSIILFMPHSTSFLDRHGSPSLRENQTRTRCPRLYSTSYHRRNQRIPHRLDSPRRSSSRPNHRPHPLSS